MKTDYSDYVLLFGGAFDPPHIGHLACIQLALQFNFHKIILIPSGDQRQDRKHHVSGAQRSEMLKLLLDENCLNHNKIIIDSLQIDHPDFKESYAIDLSKHYQNKYPHNKIGFLIGSDNAPTVPTWKNYAELLKIVTFFVAGRGGYKKQLDQDFVTLHSPDYTPLNVSSSHIRDSIKNNINQAYLTQEVQNFITQHNLYQ